METVISIPNELFNIVENYAENHGFSRNELYAVAISEFIGKKEKKNIIQKINKVCDNIDTSLNPQVKVAGKRILLDSKW